MKATGIVRRIDDLGRVVIPKEIRRTMRIREGDPSWNLLLHNTRNQAAQGFVLGYNESRPPKKRRSGLFVFTFSICPHTLWENIPSDF